MQRTNCIFLSILLFPFILNSLQKQSLFTEREYTLYKDIRKFVHLYVQQHKNYADDVDLRENQLYD